MSELVLGLDLATSTGWALMHRPARLHSSGSWDLRGVEKCMRWATFRRCLSTLLTDHECEVVLIAVEMPITFGARGRAASGARVSMGTMAHVEHIANLRGITVVEYPPASIKKELSGNGRATKDDQIASAVRRFGPLTSTNKITKGDEADARGAALTAINRVDFDGDDTP